MSVALPHLRKLLDMFRTSGLACLASLVLVVSSCSSGSTSPTDSAPSVSPTSSAPRASPTPSASPTTATPSPTPSPTPSVTPSITEEALARDGSITVTELGWGPSADNEFMTWGAVLRNSGPDISLVDITVTGLDKSGEAIASGDATLFRMPSGEAQGPGKVG